MSHLACCPTLQSFASAPSILAVRNDSDLKEHFGHRRTIDAFRYLGKGVGKAVENINKTISPGIAVSSLSGTIYQREYRSCRPGCYTGKADLSHDRDN